MNNKKVDRLPNLSIIGAMTVKYSDTPSIFHCNDYDVLLKGAYDAAVDLGVDFFQNYVQLGSNLYNEVNGFLPSKTEGRKYLITDSEELENLKKPDLEKSELMKKYLSQVKKTVDFTTDMYQ